MAVGTFATVFLTSNVNGQRILPGETGTYTLDFRLTGYRFGQ